MVMSLPRNTIGRAGKDLFSRKKDLTIVLVPYERFSSFPKAIDDLFRIVTVPFNLIVVEGNAPESVRSALERRERQHRNITIIYSKDHLSVPAAFNLSIPHIETKFALLIDNDIRITNESIHSMIQSAKNGYHGIVSPKNCLVPRKLRMQSSCGEEDGYCEISSLGIRCCFLISKEAIEKLGKLDESMNPLAMGVEITMLARSKGITIGMDQSACLQCLFDHKLRSLDRVLYRFQWDPVRTGVSRRILAERWGINLQDEPYGMWLDEKKRFLEDGSLGIFALLSRRFWQTVASASSNVTDVLAHLVAWGAGRSLRSVSNNRGSIAVGSKEAA